MVSATKLNEILRKRDDDKIKKTILWILAIVGAVAAIAAIAYGVYRYFAPDYLEDFEEDFEDDFEDDYFEDEDIQESKKKLARGQGAGEFFEYMQGDFENLRCGVVSLLVAP